MFTYMIRRARRRPLMPIAILTLCLILSFSLCFMQYNYEQEEKAYHETYSSIPVYVVVTDLSGLYTDGLKIPGFYYDVFTGTSLIEPRLSEYVKDVRAEIRRNIYLDELEMELRSPNHSDMLPDINIVWEEGFDESIFAEDAMVCIVPDDMGFVPGDIITLTIFSDYTYYDGTGNAVKASYDSDLTVVGIHNGESNVLYAPFYAGDNLVSRFNRNLYSLSATLVDNYAIEEFKELVPNWFAEPDPMGNHTSWSYGSYTYYPNALEINDNLLKRAEDTLSASLLISEMASVLVFALSAGAGFFLGFLMIRSCKQELSLMRMLGRSGGSIFFGFAAEQLLCVILGTAIGGAVFMWQPIGRLCIFAGMYSAGLFAALAVFLNRNLLYGQKEED